MAQLAAEGVAFATGVDVGVGITGDALRADFDAVCLTVGAEAANDVQIPGRELDGVHLAMDFLVQQNKRGSGEESRGPAIDAKGKRVVILGGGDTGSDCLGTVHRQGCLSVQQLEVMGKPPLSRADTTPWPLWPLKLRTSHAHEEGGERSWNVTTTGFSGASGRVEHLHCVRVAAGEGGLQAVPGTEFTLEADLVLLAIGFRGPRPLPLLTQLGVACDQRGCVKTNARYETNQPGVFAAGDAKRGASLIVWAIAEGRKMAAAVADYLAQDLVTTEPGALAVARTAAFGAGNRAI